MLQAIYRVLIDGGRVLGQADAGVGVALVVTEQVGEIIREVHQHFLMAWRTEADGDRHAVGFGDAVVGNSRGDIEHVARLQYPLVLAVEVGKNAQVRVVEQRAVDRAVLTNAPAALAVTLQQEYIVVVVVRPHAATRCRVADHDVVNPPGRQEAEPVRDLRNELIHGLDQQCPIPFRQPGVGVIREGAALQFPRVSTVLDDQPGLNFLFQRQASKFVWLNGAFKVGEGLADQQRFALPILGEEAFYANVTKQRVEFSCHHSGSRIDNARSIRALGKVCRPPRGWQIRCVLLVPRHCRCSWPGSSP